MNEKGDAAKDLSRHLRDAIDKVRADVAKVEFWADAVTGFSQPVPDYEPDNTRVWLPSEQASSLGARADDDKDQDKGPRRR